MINVIKLIAWSSYQLIEENSTNLPSFQPGLWIHNLFQWKRGEWGGAVHGQATVPGARPTSVHQVLSATSRDHKHHLMIGCANFWGIFLFWKYFAFYFIFIYPYFLYSWKDICLNCRNLFILLQCSSLFDQLYKF